MDMLGKVGAGECLANAVIANIGELAQSIEKTECLQHAGINPNADACIPSFYSLKRGTRRERALGHYCHR